LVGAGLARLPGAAVYDDFLERRGLQDRRRVREGLVDLRQEVLEGHVSASSVA